VLLTESLRSGHSTTRDCHSEERSDEESALPAKEKPLPPAAGSAPPPAAGSLSDQTGELSFKYCEGQSARPHHQTKARGTCALHSIPSPTAVNQGFLMGMDAGASRQAVTKGHIESVPLAIPPKAVHDTPAIPVGLLCEATSNNTSQSPSLQQKEEES
jgi:hypothetical protein